MLKRNKKYFVSDNTSFTECSPQVNSTKNELLHDRITKKHLLHISKAMTCLIS